MKPKTTVYWFTGLSGSGKSTIAEAFSVWCKKNDRSIRIIDGDDVRSQKHQHLDFSPESIKENNRLVTNMCKKLLGEYEYLIVSVITPFEASRKFSREMLGDHFVEVYVKASIDAVIKRDVKGLYKKALNGQIDNFIGISPNTPYEVPVNPDLVLDTENNTLDECLNKLIAFSNHYVATQ